MTTPVRHTDDQHDQAPLGPAPVAAPLGWLLALAGTIVLLLGSWLVYPDDAPGMWATYRATIFAPLAILALLALRVDLPRLPALVVVGLTGAATLAWGLLKDSPTEVRVIEIIAGALILLGTALQAGSGRDARHR